MKVQRRGPVAVAATLLCGIAYAGAAAAQESPRGGLTYFAEAATRVGAPNEALWGSCRGPELAAETSAGLRRGALSVALFHTLALQYGERCHPHYPDPVERDGALFYEYGRRSTLAGEGLYSSVGVRLAAERRLDGVATLRAHAGPEWIPERGALAASAGAGMTLRFGDGRRIGVGADVRLLRVPFRIQTEERRGGHPVSATSRTETSWHAQPGFRVSLPFPSPERAAAGDAPSPRRGWFVGVASGFGPGNVFGDGEAVERLNGQIAVGHRFPGASLSAYYGITARTDMECACVGPVPPENGTRAERSLGARDAAEASLGVRAALELPVVQGALVRPHAGVEWHPGIGAWGPVGGTSLGFPISDRLLLWAGGETSLLRVPYRTTFYEYRDWDLVSQHEAGTPAWESVGALRIGLEVTP